jgi:hypothetical protein
MEVCPCPLQLLEAFFASPFPSPNFCIPFPVPNQFGCGDVFLGYGGFFFHPHILGYGGFFFHPLHVKPSSAPLFQPLPPFPPLSTRNAFIFHLFVPSLALLFQTRKAFIFHLLIPSGNRLRMHNGSSSRLRIPQLDSSSWHSPSLIHLVGVDK